MQITVTVDELLAFQFDHELLTGGGRSALIPVPPLPEATARVVARRRGYDPDQVSPRGYPMWRHYAEGGVQIPATAYAELEGMILAETTIVPY
jgi:hypothetical protein